MKIIEELSDKIADEVKCAESYMKCALHHKEDYPLVADVYYKIANDKMSHVSLLHAQVVALIEEYKKSGKTIPEHMQMLYDILHKKHIEQAAAVKGMLVLYKE